MALQAFFCNMNIILIMFRTSIPCSKNVLMREQYNVFIVSSGKYVDNLNNMLEM